MKTPVREELLEYRKAGTTFWAEVDITPVREKAGRCRYFVAVMRDITDKKRQSATLRPRPSSSSAHRT
jgi:PAS domain S-box-containing protein